MTELSKLEEPSSPQIMDKRTYMKKLDKISLITIEYNAWNGFYIHLLEIEWGDFDRSLFGFWTNWRDHIVIDFLFLRYNSMKKV